MQQFIGVIGSGRFGTAICSILANNKKVLLYTRSTDIANTINTTHKHLGYQLSKNIIATTNLKFLCDHCQLIFPVVPSQKFRE